MQTLSVNVVRSEMVSPLWVGRHLIERIATLAPLQKYTSVVVVADSGAKTSVERLLGTLQIPSERVLTLSGGERMKEVSGLQDVWRFFVDQKLDRRSLVITMGGGALSDLVGFAAATFMRGIAFLHIPTTLLAQVDASIGGKTGINFMGVKNLLGSIVQPVGILVDIDALCTLPAREIRSGFAEIIKHGLIWDADYFKLTTSRPCSKWTPDELVEIVARSCEIKKTVVEADETEQSLRKMLNFGHTIGHAVEGFALDNDIPLTHGEAVAIGMVAESYLSWKSGRISEDVFHTIRRGIVHAELPIELPVAIAANELQRFIVRDKKNVGREVRWVLLERIGKACFDIVVPENLVTEALESIQPR